MVPELEPEVLSLVEPLDPVDGPVAVAPAITPWDAGTRYVVAEIVAVIWGKPAGGAPRLIALSVNNRPLTDTCCS